MNPGGQCSLVGQTLFPIVYVGNTRLSRFECPPQEVLEKFGVKQIVI